MRIVIGADHAGYDLKEIITAYLRHLGYEVIDKGTDSDESGRLPGLRRSGSETIVDGEA
jgi:ribose 5-phosphate isomerase B